MKVTSHKSSSLPVGPTLFALILFIGCQSTPEPMANECPPADAQHFPTPPGMDPDGSCNDGCKRPDDFGPYAVPAPLGTYVDGWNNALICSARGQEYVISRNEWFSGGDQLGPDGRQHVAALANSLIYNGKYVILETEPVMLESNESYDEAQARTAAINEQRRINVVAELGQYGLTDAEQRVILSPVERVGVRGAEAPRIYNRLINGRGQNGNGQGIRGGLGSGNGGLGGFGGGFGGGVF